MNKKQIAVLFFTMLAVTASMVADSTPVISRVYGDYLRNESIAQQQNLPSRGVSGLDETYNDDGLVSLNSALGLLSNDIDILKIVRQEDDKLIVVVYDNTVSAIKAFRLTTTGALDSGFGTYNYLLASVVYIEDMEILVSLTSVEDIIYDDSNNKILIISDSGSNSGTLYSYFADGSTAGEAGVSDVSPQKADISSTNLSDAKLTMLSDNTIVLFARTSASKPQLKFYTYPASTAATFGSPTTTTFDADGSDGSITVKGIVADGSNNIYVAYMVSSTAYVAKLSSSGVLNSHFGVSGRISFTSTSDVGIALEANGTLAVATLNSAADTITVTRVSCSTGSVGITGTLTSDAGDISFGGLLPTGDGNLFVYGAEVGTSSASGLNEILIKRLRNIDYAADTTFNTNGTLKITPTTSGSAFTRTAPASAILSSGDILMGLNEIVDTAHTAFIGKVNAEAATVAIKQFAQDFGTAPTVLGDGSVDVSFGTQGAFKPFAGVYEGALQQKVRGAARLATDKIMLVMDGKGNTNASSHITLARLTSSGAFDTTFNSTGFAEQNFAAKSAVVNVGATSTAEYVKSFFVDKNGKYLVAGYATNGGDKGLLRRFSAIGVADDYSGTECSVTTSDVSVFYDVAVQSNNRVIVCGKSGSDGKIIAYKGSSLAVDSTFASSGVYTLTGGGISSIAINSFDNIYFVARYGSDNHMFLYCLDENGDVLNKNFNTNGYVDTGITIDSSRIDQMKVALDADSNIVVACINSNNNMCFQRYSSAGVQLGSNVVIDFADPLILRDIKVLTDNSVLLIGAYDSTDDSMFVARIASDNTLDTTFGTNGLSLIQVAPQAQYAREFSTAVVQSTGAIVAVGYESFIDTESCPVVVRLNSTGGTAEVSQVVSAVDGDIDTTLSSTGIVDLQTILGVNGTATSIYHYKTYHAAGIDSRFLVAWYNGSDSYIARFTTDGQLDTSFGSSGIVTISSAAHINHIILDKQDKILACGGDGTDNSAWVKRLAADGSSVELSFSLPATAYQNAYKVLEQESGRIIVAAEKNDDSLAVLALRSTGALDTSFNPLGQVPGVFQLVSARDLGQTAAAGCVDIAIGKSDGVSNYGYDKIYIAYKVGDTPKIARLHEHGILDTYFGSSGIVDSGATASTGSNVRIVVNELQQPSIGYVVAGSTNRDFVIKRIANNGQSVLGTATFADLGAGAQITAMMSVTTNQNAYALGYNSAGDLLFTRTSTTGSAVDTTFSSDGIQTITGGSSATLQAAALTLDGRIFVVGSQVVSGPATHPLLAAVYGTVYSQEWEQHPRASGVDTSDYTLINANPVGKTAGKLDFSSSEYLNASGYKVKRVYKYAGATGGVLVAFDNSSVNTIKLMKLKADRTKDTSFGSSGVVTISSVSVNSVLTSGNFSSVTPTTVSDLFVDKDGAIYLSGAGASSRGWVVKLSSVGEVSTSFNITDELSDILSDIRKVVRFTDTKIVLSGKHIGSTNYVAMYAVDGTTGNRDYTFNVSVGANGTEGFTDMAVDEYNRIYALYQDGTNAHLYRILPYGAVETDAASIVMDFVNAGKARIAIDQAHGKVAFITVSGDGRNIYVRTYSYDNTDSLTAVNNSISFSDGIIGLAARYDSAGNLYVVGYNNSGAISAVRVNSSLAIDTTFYGAAGSIQSNSDFSLNAAPDFIIHDDRRLDIFGYINSGTSYMVRLFGDLYNTQVNEETALRPTGSKDLILDKATADGYKELNYASTQGKKVVYSSSANKLVLAIDNGTDTQILVSDLDGHTINSGATLTSKKGIMSAVELYGSAENGILVAGDTGSACWVYKINPSTGAVAITYTIPEVITSLQGALAQRSGRIILYGKDSSTGVVAALKNDGLGQDILFVPSNGSHAYQTGVNAPVQAAVIDVNDNIYIAYKNGTDIKLRKLKANGVLDTAFGTSGTYTISKDVDSIKLTISASNQLIISGVYADAIWVWGLDLTGQTLSTPFELAAGNLTDTVSGVTVTDPVLQDTFVDSSGLVYLVGKSSGSDKPFVVRLASDLSAVDTTFNASTVGGTDNGYWAILATSSSDNPATFNSAYEQQDGHIALFGTSTNSKPVLTRLVGNMFTTQVKTTQTRALAGVVDTTTDIGTGLNINTLTGLSGHTVIRYAYAYTDGSGKMLVVTQGSTDSTLMRLNADYTLDTTFNSSGYVTLSSKKGANKIMVDESGNIFVVGTDATVGGWLFACNSTGGAISELTAFNTPATLPSVKTMSKINAVARQSSQRVLVAGYNSTDSSGCIMALTVDATDGTTSLDLSFGSNKGYYNTGVATEISDMYVDSYDRIVFTYRDGTYVKAVRLLPNGVSLDPAFIHADGTVGIVSLPSEIVNDSSYDNQIKISPSTKAGYDRIILAFIKDGISAKNTLRVIHLLNNGGQAALSSKNITSGSVITSLKADSQNRFVVTGYDGTAPWLARVASNGDFDTSFNSTGYVSLSSTTLKTACDTVILPDSRYLVLGSNTGATAGIIARVFGDLYSTVYTENPSIGAMGTIDTHLSRSGAANYLDISGGTGMIPVLAGTTVRNMVLVNKTKFYLVSSDATQSYIAAISVDGVPDNSFGLYYNTSTINGYTAGQLYYDGTAVRKTSDDSSVATVSATLSGATYTVATTSYAGTYTRNGLRIIAGKVGGSNIIYNKAGNILVSGNTGSATWAREYSTSGALVTSYADISTMTVLQGLAQQSTSRVIVGGYNADNQFVLAGYTPTGLVDSSFGLGSGQLLKTAYHGISHFIVDQRNRVVASFVDGSNHVILSRVGVHGKALDVTFNTTGLVDTGITVSGSSVVARVLAVQDNKMVVAAPTSTNTIAVNRYNSIGGSDTTIEIDASLQAPVVTQLLLTSSGKLLIVGYDNVTGSNDKMFIIRLTASLTLDSSFAETTLGANDGVGYIKFEGNSGSSTRQLADGIILRNGQIVVVGNEV